jgi:hypothetical protein
MNTEGANTRGEDLGAQLDRLLAAYREACPDVDPGPTFMPGLWKRIEAYRSPAPALRRWAGTLVTTAVALCVLLGILTTTTSRNIPDPTRATYIEVLAAENLSEGYPYFEVVAAETGGMNHR